MIIDFAYLYRSGRVESVHGGVAVLADTAETLRSWGDSTFSTYARSLLKPIQAKVALGLLGEDLPEELIAIATSSHMAESCHLQSLKKLQEWFDLSEADLLCGDVSKSRGQLPSDLHHNCSGKHSLFAAVCKRKSWDIKTYNLIEHPLQQKVAEEIASLLLCSTNDLLWGADGCSFPSLYLSMGAFAGLFASITANPHYQAIYSAMQSFPELIGGSQQLDSHLLQRELGLWAKGGAEGLFVVGNLKLGQAMVLKILDGANRAKSYAVLKLLAELSWISKDEYIELLAKHNDKNIYSADGTLVTGLQVSEHFTHQL